MLATWLPYLFGIFQITFQKQVRSSDSTLTFFFLPAFSGVVDGNKRIEATRKLAFLGGGMILFVFLSVQISFQGFIADFSNPVCDISIAALSSYINYSIKIDLAPDTMPPRRGSQISTEAKHLMAK